MIKASAIKRSLKIVTLLFVMVFLGLTKAQALPLALPAWIDGGATLIKEALQKKDLFGDEYALNRADLITLYEQREYRPAWKTRDENDRGSLLNLVSSIEDFTTYHGLITDTHPASLIRQYIAGKGDDNATNLELLITDWLVKIAHDLNGDKVNLRQLYVGWEFDRPKIDLMKELATAIETGDVEAFFGRVAPTTLEYKALAQALADYRELAEKGGWSGVAEGPTLKPGTSDARVPAIRARLAAERYVVPDATLSEDPNYYNDALKEVVIAYQARNGLEADGNIGVKTIAAMNVPVSQRVEQIMANMERMRHMPRDFPDRYALVNIASAAIKVFEGGRGIYHAPVIVGRTDRKTPFIESAIRSVIFNPSWHVPAKIAREDILPKLRKDPHYLEKMGFAIKSSDDEDPYGTQVDWDAIKASEFTFRLRQAPGEQNSLGRIKFDFNNKHAVYLHGTPHEELFAKADRQLSSGCVRLKDPEEFAEIVLKPNGPEWTIDSIKGEVDKRSTHWQQVNVPLPLYIIYQTAFFPAPESPLNFRRDVYRYDRLLIDAMKRKSI